MDAPGSWSLPAAFGALLDLAHEVRHLREGLAAAEADRAVRLRDVNTLTALLREAEADRAARLEVIQRLEARMADIGRTWAWRLWLYSTLPPSLTRRKPVD